MAVRSIRERRIDLDEKTGMEGDCGMTQITLGEALLLIIGGGLILGLSYWLGLKNGRLCGREVGEFKHNDILMTDDGPITVMRPSSGVPYRGGMVNVDELYQHGKIEGIYPDESFISFEDGESK
ncbi:hypothetical protein FQ087_18800 [Sporosarcina sp. ANT_H38]|uniref:hypothetical protein n=1 Tax=Sporosarcina sp. ANT_H38 TaxID=2597358 RepID=UPI0011F3137E|nr:hypothetical protein [Sporosarcina sp. ANT_H38]KAA0944174.1 hypothetical protein FQ087_18800 [Sporosarcina sp. ANT_H38]